MSTSAEVRSLAQLHKLRERCALCRAQTLKEAEVLLAELHKLTRWLDEEAAAYWERERAVAERWMKECQEALMRCQAAVRADEKRACTDERKRLERAAQRRALCEAKVKAVGEARLLWQRQVVKLRGRLQSTADMAESELLTTIHRLGGIIGTLETYAQVRSPADSSVSPPPASISVPDSAPLVTPTVAPSPVAPSPVPSSPVAPARDGADDPSQF